MTVRELLNRTTMGTKVTVYDGESGGKLYAGKVGTVAQRALQDDAMEVNSIRVTSRGEMIVVVGNPAKIYTVWHHGAL